MFSTRPRFALLAGFQILAGLAILPYTLTEPHPSNSLADACAIAWLLLAAVNWLLAKRLPPEGFEVSLYASAIVIACHSSWTPRPQMQVLDGLELLVLGMFAAFALTSQRVHVWLAFSGAIYVAALVYNTLPIGVWLGPVIVVMVVATTSVVGRLILEVQEVSRLDPLTGALNRLGLADQSAILQSVAQRARDPLSVVFIDLDGFKGFNDTHGHLAGDQLLTELVAALRRNLRASDLVARVGGDEFVVVMARVDRSQAERVMIRIQGRLPISVSFGAVDWAPDTDLAEVIDLADRAMYQRKRRTKAKPNVPEPR